MWQSPFFFRLANKQDKMNALLGNELIEILSLEKLVNESRSLCHIVSILIQINKYPWWYWNRTKAHDFLSIPSQEPCSALMDLRRWPDRRTQRGLRWLLRAIYMDYPELCARVAQDRKRPVEAREQEKSWKTGKMRGKNKTERHRLRSFHFLSNKSHF